MLYLYIISYVEILPFFFTLPRALFALLRQRYLSIVVFYSILTIYMPFNFNIYTVFSTFHFINFESCNKHLNV